jgi:hypothetical protein
MRNLVSNYEEPDGREVVVLLDGTAVEAKAFVYDGRGFKGAWTKDGRWIPEREIVDVEADPPATTCEGSVGPQ